MVDKYRVKGSAEQAKGKAKEWAARPPAIQKQKVKARPTMLRARYVKGKVQNTVGGLKDAVREK